MDNASRSQRRKPPARAVIKREAAPDRVAAIDVGSLGDHLGYALKRAQLRVFDDFIRAVAPLKLSPAQFSVLILLDANSGRNQAEIAAALGILRPNFVKLLDELEARGLCRRTRSEDDRRSHVLTLTDKGRATLAKATRLVADKHDKKLATLLRASERAQLMAVLDRIARAL